MTPMYAYSALPSSRSWSIERWTMSTGTAKPTPSSAARRGADLLVDPDHAAVGVEQRPAGVAGVDRGVGLDRVVDLEVGQRLDRAVRWPRPRRPRASSPRRTGCRSPRPARRPRSRCSSRASSGSRSRPVGVDLEQRRRRRSGRSRRSPPGPGCGRGTGRRPPSPRGSCRRRWPRVGDDVGVGDDLAVVVDHEARCPARPPAAAAEDARRARPSNSERIVTTPGEAFS